MPITEFCIRDVVCGSRDKSATFFAAQSDFTALGEL